jgi:nickel-dependent lactate racemase
VRRLIENGVPRSNLAIIFATGIHRAVREQEKTELLTSFIAQRIRTIDHNASDASQLMKSALWPTARPSSQSGVERILESDPHRRRGFHYFAGFTGGRKSICPGLASARTIEATHMLALDFERGGRRQGVGTGLLDGNAVSEECERVADVIDPAFSINAIVNENGRVEKIFAGNWRAAHRRACEDYLANHSLRISEKRDLVIVSCGGSPTTST